MNTKPWSSRLLTALGRRFGLSVDALAAQAEDSGALFRVDKAQLSKWRNGHPKRCAPADLLPLIADLYPEAGPVILRSLAREMGLAVRVLEEEPPASTDLEADAEHVRELGVDLHRLLRGTSDDLDDEDRVEALDHLRNLEDSLSRLRVALEASQ